MQWGRISWMKSPTGDTIHFGTPTFWCHRIGRNDRGCMLFLVSIICCPVSPNWRAAQRGQQENPSKTTLPAHDPSCYLCPGNKRAQGDVNPQYDSTFVFVNDYSAVKEEQASYERDEGNGSMNWLFRRTCLLWTSIESETDNNGL